MIVDIFLYLLGALIGILQVILPDWLIWPEALREMFEYFAAHIAEFNFILAVDTFFASVEMFLDFLMLYISYRLVKKLVNWMRGSGEI